MFSKLRLYIAFAPGYLLYDMKLGPFPNYFIEILKEKLTRAGGDFSISTSQEALADYHERLRLREPSADPRFIKQEDLLFIEIEPESISCVKEELEKFGVLVPVENSILEDFDFLCPKCDFVAHAQGYCPQHKTPLLEFSEWRKACEPESFLGKFVVLTALPLVVGWIIWTIYWYLVQWYGF